MGTGHKSRLSDLKKLLGEIHNNISTNEWIILKPILKDCLKKQSYPDSKKEYSELEVTTHTILIAIEELRLKNNSILAILLYYPLKHGIVSMEQAEKLFDKDTIHILKGLKKVRELEYNPSALESDNYLKLLLSFAEDIRVILIMIANQLYLMRSGKSYSEELRLRLSVETTYLYAPLAHKLGLYKVKSELEDLCLKYTDREAYDYISRKINETKTSRDKYISEFIAPINKKLKETGLKYDIKGRTKSIFSINNKLKKQKIEFDSVYDLFAIRIILDSPLEREKADCWQVYSIITDLYQPNPNRLKDWLSIPKTNGYESLHITVMGPGSRWVEVQIRTQRMDEIAERGLAAHWKYKGIKSQNNLDDWLTNLRETLENQNLDTQEKLEDFRLDMYDEEIYVFTPKGDLHKLPKGATVIDFAFSIHSKVGSACISGKVNGKNEPIRHKLRNGDVIEIITSPNQTPKQDWLSFAVTSRARNRIRQSLKEEANKQVEYAKELLKRRMKNRKIEEDDKVLMKLIKKLGFKTVTDFYINIASERLDINHIIDQYIAEKKETENKGVHEIKSAENFTILSQELQKENIRDELILDKDLTGVDYKLARCCNPIYGDEIFGFISSQGIKIHRRNCPNAHDMFSRFGYRIIPARWSGKSDSQYTITLRVIGNDDLGIVTNLTSIISKEVGVSMRSINIDSTDGLFHGNISVNLNNTEALNGLIKKLKTVKGVKQISRIN